MLIHLSHPIGNPVELLVQSIGIAVHSIESFYTKSIYVRQRGLARPKFFFLGDGVMPSETASLAFRSMIGSQYTSVLMRPRQREGLRVSMRMM